MDTRNTRDDAAQFKPQRGAAPVKPQPTLLKRLLDRALVSMRAPLAPQAKTVFESFEPRVLLAGDPIAPPRIDGSLDVAGETDR